MHGQVQRFLMMTIKYMVLLTHNFMVNTAEVSYLPFLHLLIVFLRWVSVCPQLLLHRLQLLLHLCHLQMSLICKWMIFYVIIVLVHCHWDIGEWIKRVGNSKLRGKNERQWSHQSPSHLLLQLFQFGVHFIKRCQALVTIFFLQILPLQVFQALKQSHKHI